MPTGWGKKGRGGVLFSRLPAREGGRETLVFVLYFSRRGKREKPEAVKPYGIKKEGEEGKEESLSPAAARGSKEKGKYAPRICLQGGKGRKSPLGRRKDVAPPTFFSEGKKGRGKKRRRPFDGGKRGGGDTEIQRI